jgi:glycolate oxidase iron-sulfur subunit
MLNQTKMAAQLLSDKITAIQQSQPQILATSNIGCALHIAAGLREKHSSVAVLHPVSIMAKQIGFTGKLD